jgi:glycosyltransferase involved in cell wall biosynthesis
VPFEQKLNIILTVGRLTAFKRLDVLVQAFAQAALPGTELYIVGDGEERLALTAQIQQLGLTNRVKLLTQVTDTELKYYYAAAKLFVLCSKAEPFGIVITEALVSGTAVVADASGGPTEIVMHGQNGELIDCTVAQLASTLRRLWIQPDVLQRYSSQARSLTAARFSWETAARKVVSYI